MRSRLLLLALAAALGGCGGGEDDDRREAVSSYLAQANTELQRSAGAFAEADTALREFSLTGKGAEASARELGEVLETLAATRERLAKLSPPAEARRLHADTLELLETQTELADDLRRLAQHLPAAAAILRDVEVARTRLQRSLEAAKTPVEQAAAARTYAHSAGDSLADLRELEPPEILAEWHAGQLNVLRTSQRLARELADALEAKDEAKIERVLSGFEKVSRDATAAARAQVVAVRDFNRRVEAQRQLVERIGREQRRLDTALR